MQYLRGDGVVADDMRAAHWLGQAASQGHPAAQHDLALLCARGRGLRQDREAAARWLGLAAAQGMRPARERLLVAAGSRNRPGTDAPAVAEPPR